MNNIQEIVAEISMLERQRDELEADLKKIITTFSVGDSSSISMRHIQAIERPTLEIETPKLDTPIEATRPKPEATKDGPEAQPQLDPAAELAQLESEFGQGSHDYSADEIGDWEFDELERELRSGDSTPCK
ncbi:hypothetical protein V6N13_121872 [Hibiscus sabdariffa]